MKRNSKTLINHVDLGVIMSLIKFVTLYIHIETNGEKTRIELVCLIYYLFSEMNKELNDRK